MGIMEKIDEITILGFVVSGLGYSGCSGFIGYEEIMEKNMETTTV